MHFDPNLHLLETSSGFGPFRTLTGPLAVGNRDIAQLVPFHLTFETHQGPQDSHPYEYWDWQGLKTIQTVIIDQ